MTNEPASPAKGTPSLQGRGRGLGSQAAFLKATLALISLTVFAACASPTPPASPTPIPTATLAPVATAPGQDEYAVYDAIILANWPGQALIVIEDTTATNQLPAGKIDVRGYVASQMTDLQTQTTDSFLAGNMTTYLLANQFHIASPIVFLSKAGEQKIFDRELQVSWRQFYTAYPGAQGILVFSRVGLNAPMDQALVYYQNSKGGLDAAGYMVLLSKVTAGWVVKKQFLLWVA